MKNTAVYIFTLAAFCCIVFGCASAKQNTKIAVEKTYNAVEKTDNWIEKNMW